MKNFNNSNKFGRSGGRRKFEGRDAGRGRFGSQSSGRSQMYDAVCADCGNNCKVPFMPSSGKPVYCSDCFENRGNGRSSDTDRSRRPSMPSRDSFSTPKQQPQKDYDRQFEILNTKLDKILKALESKEMTPKEEVKVKKSAKKKVAKPKVAESKTEVTIN